MEKTIGEKRVRTDFNFASSDGVDNLKNSTAKLIDVLEDFKLRKSEESEPERLRLIALAQTAYEEATMWAVKAVTFKSE